MAFLSSPTIRVNGADIALELQESSCGSEACTDGCGDQIACRVWVHQGREYTEPPTELIVDAILRHVYGPPAPAAWTRAQPYEVPENLQRFFAGKPTSTRATTVRGGGARRGAGRNRVLLARGSGDLLRRVGEGGLLRRRTSRAVGAGEH